MVLLLQRTYYKVSTSFLINSYQELTSNHQSKQLDKLRGKKNEECSYPYNKNMMQNSYNIQILSCVQLKNKTKQLELTII